jgi:hypothetical protein
VAQKLLNEFRMHPLSEQQGSASMPQVMERDPRKMTSLSGELSSGGIPPPEPMVCVLLLPNDAEDVREALSGL